MSKIFPLLSLLFVSLIGTTQELKYQSVLLSPELTKNANAIIRSEKVEIEIESIDKIIIRTERVVTILNEHGKGVERTGNVYDNDTEIKKQEAVFYDQFGKEIKKVKKRDFLDQSLPGANLVTDNRLSFYDYVPQEYPYTVVYTSEVESGSTIFVRSWNPLPGYHVSVESSSYSLKNSAGIPIRFEEKNLDSLQIEKFNSALELNYKLTHMPAFSREPLSPDFDNLAPEVKVALEEFTLEGVQGSATDWADLGKWQYDHLLSDKIELSPETIRKIDAITSTAETDMEKARLIYEYMQENTRYISVQLGIGGWEPMPASDVDKLGYGDCKALTNYTRALLQTQGIKSYYTVVYAGEERVDIDPNFPSMQGNHAILNIPFEGEDVWLECTSQTMPFNYIGDFTDNRNVLVIKPEGSEIIKTRAYPGSQNLQESVTTIILDDQGGFSAEFLRRSTGVPYGNTYYVMRKSETDQRLHYKEKWGHLRNLELEEIKFTNNRLQTEFVEELKISGERYASKAGDRILLPLHFLNLSTYSLPNNPNREFPVEIHRGRTYKESFEFVLPVGFKTESLPESVKIETEYGSFSSQIDLTEKDGQKIILLQRFYVIKAGVWPADSYEEYRDFMNRINALGKQKAVIIKTS